MCYRKAQKARGAARLPLSYFLSPVSFLPLRRSLTFLRFRTALFTLDAAFYLTNFVLWFDTTRRWAVSFVRTPGEDAKGKKGRKGGFEDVLENQMREMGTCSLQSSL